MASALRRLQRSWRANTLKIRPRLAFATLAARLLPHDMFNLRRAAIYRAAGIRIGSGAQVLGPLTLLGWGDIARHLEVGDEAALETPFTISLCATVSIGHRVHTGPETMILTGSHDFKDGQQRSGTYEFKPVKIGDGCWLGARVLILPGVTIGEGCVVAAGSVVTHSMPPHSLIAGNPARVVRKLDVRGACMDKERP